MASSPASPLPMSFSPHSHSQGKPKRSKHRSNSPANENEKHKRKKTPSPSLELPSKEQFVQLVGVLAVAVLVATSTTYIIDWYFKPFCDSDAELQVLPDSCIPCPKHGRCGGGRLECFPGFIKQGRTCKENRELDKKAQKLADWVKDHACGLYAQSMCNGAGIFWLPWENLRRELNQNDLMEEFNLKVDEIPFLQEKAMDIIYGLFEMRTTLDGLEEFKCPDWLAEKYKPLGCRTREWISNNYLFLFIVFPLALVVFKFLWGLYKRKRTMARAEHLYQQVCEALEEKAFMEKSKGGAGEPWVVASRLRDHLLLPRERKNTSLWKQVEELIQEDSRIDQYPKLVKGESRTVLEWQVEGAPCSRTKHRDINNRTLPTKDDFSGG
ncbi:uncharacterized protein LOC131031391 isoform X2 [Cryptomeria japonica]|uniref:uncharacterized protein LOC131031391 isoform X2 n=1 Tax=Cryptomeria japonica TaxID=3369 RepID=UPI0027DA5BAA|nr:uncharacterized protein LOC131031391 isoform X2 [Cryptomeria japonica]